MRRGSSSCSASGSVRGAELFCLIIDSFSVGIEIVEGIHRGCKTGERLEIY